VFYDMLQPTWPSSGKTNTVLLPEYLIQHTKPLKGIKKKAS
jgi:hypothetical protein